MVKAITPTIQEIAQRKIHPGAYEGVYALSPTVYAYPLNGMWIRVSSPSKAHAIAMLTPSQAYMIYAHANGGHEATANAAHAAFLAAKGPDYGTW